MKYHYTKLVETKNCIRRLWRRKWRIQSDPIRSDPTPHFVEAGGHSKGNKNILFTFYRVHYQWYWTFYLKYFVYVLSCTLSVILDILLKIFCLLFIVYIISDIGHFDLKYFVYVLSCTLSVILDILLKNILLLLLLIHIMFGVFLYSWKGSFFFLYINFLQNISD